MWRTDWFPLNSHFLKHSFKWLMEGMLYHLDLWLLHSDRRACSWLVHQKRSVQIESFIDFLPFSLEMSFLWIAVGWRCGGAAYVCVACLNYVIANQGIYVCRNPHLLLQPPFRPMPQKPCLICRRWRCKHRFSSTTDHVRSWRVVTMSWHVELRVTAVRHRTTVFAAEHVKHVNIIRYSSWNQFN